eukprot:scaffold117484_cov15-Tisochrysis_lutea.AAC.1
MPKQDRAGWQGRFFQSSSMYNTIVQSPSSCPSAAHFICFSAYAQKQVILDQAITFSTHAIMCQEAAGFAASWVE